MRVVTLTAAGRAFCAGADLKAVRELSPDPVKWNDFMRLWHRVFNRIEALPVPVIAGVHGLALAGGLELVLVVDLVVADESARLGDQHANFGLVAGGGGSQRLPRLIGARRAKELMLLGGWLSAAQALEWGLVNRVVPAGRLAAAVDEMAVALAGKSRSGNRTVKALVDRGLDTDLGKGLALELVSWPSTCARPMPRRDCAPSPRSARRSSARAREGQRAREAVLLRAVGSTGLHARYASAARLRARLAAGPFSSLSVRSSDRLSRRRPMDFAFTPEQEELVRTLRGFVPKELAPRSAQWDRTGEFPWDAWRQMGELGLLGLRTPAAYGGQEADLLTIGIAIEEIARGDFSCTYGIQLAGLAGEILGKSGSDEIKARWLPATARGETIVALALTEPGAGSDAASLSCRAERDGDDYVITGEKSGISLGMVAQAAIVFARTDADAKARGVTAFLVPLDLPGVSRSALRDMGTHAIARAVLSFDHVRMPASHRLGRRGHGLLPGHAGLRLQPRRHRARLPRRRAGLARGDDGLREGAPGVRPRARALRGRVVSHRGGGDARRGVRGCSATARSGWPTAGAPYTKESAMVKWWGPRLAVDTIHQCLLLHGHYGYTDELPFEQRMRDVIGLEIGDGTAEVMKIVVARELMGRESLPY